MPEQHGDLEAAKRRSIRLFEWPTHADKGQEPQRVDEQRVSASVSVVHIHHGTYIRLNVYLYCCVSFDFI